MAGSADLPLEVHLARTEGPLRRLARAAQRTLELARFTHDRHANAATAPTRLDDQWKPERFRDLERPVVRENLIVARDQRHPLRGHRRTSTVLLAHQLDVISAGADEAEAALSACSCERRVL